MILSLSGLPAIAEQAADIVSLKGLSGSASSTAVIARESEIIESASSPGDPAVIDALLRRAEAYQTQGYLQEASRDATSAASAARARDDADRLARALGVTGAIEYMAGRAETARQRFGDSLELARANGDGVIEAATLLNIGNTWIDDDRQKAAEAYAAAAERGEALGLSQIAAQAYLNLARFESLTVKDYTTAASYLDRAENYIRRLSDVHERGKRLLALGVLNRDLARVRPGGADKAVAVLNEAAAIGGQIADPRLESQAWGELAELDAREGKSDRALRRAEDGLRLARAAEAPDLAYRWQRQIGRLRSSDGDTWGAIVAYRDTVATLRPLRAEIAATTSAGGAEFRNTLAVTYLEYADLLFRQADHTTNAEAGQLLLGEARDALEQLRSAELENYFQNECITELQSQTRSLDWGTEETAIIYPVIFPQQLVLLAQVGRRFYRYSVAVDAATLRRQVERLRLTLSGPGSDDIASAKELYDLLVRPMEEVLHTQEVTTLVIVPDGVLRLVPWAALHDGQTYLGDKVAIAIAPSFELINPQSLKEIRPLVAALTESRPPWRPLQFVGDEIREIQSLFPATTVLQNQAFVRGQLEASLNATPYSLVHIASHARFGQSAKDSFIVTYDDDLDMNELERAMNPTRFRDEPVELIVLSACETATGDEQAALGLAGVAIKAGARSALASLWGADDRAAYQLVTGFYRSLAAGQTKAEALRSAQRHVRTTPGMQHPYYWAPFVIIGNWL